MFIEIIPLKLVFQLNYCLSVEFFIRCWLIIKLLRNLSHLSEKNILIPCCVLTLNEF